jgi:PAS domain S-box-containing protein
MAENPDLHKDPDTVPSGLQIENISFEDLFNLDDIQLLQDQFASATGVASIITHTDGTPITKPSNFCRLCSDIIRKTKKGRANCYKSDAVIGQMSPEGPTIQPCMSGGLWDAGAAVSIKGRHIANWLIGQVRDSTQTEERIREYAREIEADETEAAKAFMEVPSMSRDRFSQISQMLFTLANQLSATAYQNVLQVAYINEINNAQEALRENEAYLRTLMRTIPDLVWLKDLHGVFLFCNSRFERLFGASEKKIIGKTDYDFVNKEQADFFRNNDNLAAAQGKPSKNEEELTFMDDGHHETVETIKTPVYENNGKLIGVLGIARDITERRNAENELKETKELLQSFLDSATDAMMVWDASLNLKEINKFGLSYFPDGTKKEDLIGKNLKEFSNMFSDKSIADKFNGVLESGKPVFFEESVTVNKNNSRWFNTRLFKVGDGIGAIVNDSTERRRLE